MPPKEHNIDSLAAIGRSLLSSGDAVEAHGRFERWDLFVAHWLDKQAPNTGFSAQWSSLPGSTLVTGGQYYDYPEAWASFRSAVQKRLAWLATFGRDLALSKIEPAGAKTADRMESKRVFIVHGRNEHIREKVARFVEKLGLEVVVLHEQPNKGRTIIEKFIGHADVAFAIALLTADDLGGLTASDIGPRARQNVIFELGYFLGRLGREKVCALYEEGVEILSDYSGVLYITLDVNEAWKFQLAREMKAAGLSVDLNRIV